MKTLVIFLAIFATCLHTSQQLRNLMGTPEFKCIECLCHARTGCYRRANCASYSIDYDYWMKAGHPTLPNDDPNEESSYRNCMRNENCIVNTIVMYTDTFNRADCNCDEEYDCIDMLKLHLFGEECGSIMDQRQINRFNNCARMNNLKNMTSNNYCEVEAQ